MTPASAPSRLPTNPFATRFIRPGVLPPLDVHGRPVEVARLLESLPTLGRIATIVGPHGHGKTTLLTAIARAAASTGRGVTWLTVRSVADAWRTVAVVGRTRHGDLVCIDGWERMLCGTARIARVLARVRGCSLLVTTHGAGPLPVLARCTSSPMLLAAIVALVPDSRGHISPSDIEAAFHRHRGDIREALSELYDRFEDSVRRTAAVRI